VIEAFSGLAKSTENAICDPFSESTRSSSSNRKSVLRSHSGAFDVVVGGHMSPQPLFHHEGRLHSTTIGRARSFLTIRDVVRKQFGEWDESWQRQYFEEKWKPQKYEIIEPTERRIGALSVSRTNEEVRIVEIQLLPE
jgi:hypothetical protein